MNGVTLFPDRFAGASSKQRLYIVAALETLIGFFIADLGIRIVRVRENMFVPVQIQIEIVFHQ